MQAIFAVAHLHRLHFAVLHEQVVTNLSRSTDDVLGNHLGTIPILLVQEVSNLIHSLAISTLLDNTK